MNKKQKLATAFLLCLVPTFCNNTFGQIFEDTKEQDIIRKLEAEVADLRNALVASNIELEEFRRAKKAPKMVQVYALQNVSARDAVKTLSELKLDGEAKFASDDRTNSLIVSSKGDTQKVIGAIIEQIDSKARDADMTTRSYKVSRKVADSLAEVLRNTLSQSRSRFSYSNNGMLVVQAKDRDHLRITELINEFVESEKKAPAKSKTVRVVWLVDGLEQPAKMPKDMRPVIDELEAMGVENLGVASQSLIRTSASSEFDLTCKALLEEPCDLSIQGTITQENLMNLTIQAIQQSKVTGPTRGRTAASHLAAINTAIVFSPGHPVVLGISPIGKRTSVFVVTVNEGN